MPRWIFTIFSRVALIMNFSKNLKTICDQGCFESPGCKNSIRNDVIRQQISESLSPSYVFALVLTVAEIFAYQICYHEKVGQGHGLQHLQRRHLMANSKIYKHNFYIFFVFSPRKPVRTKVTKTHKRREMYKSLALGEIEQICLIRTFHFWLCQFTEKTMGGTENTITKVRALQNKYPQQ